MGSRPPLGDVRLTHQQLPERVYETLRDAILRGDFRRGERLGQVQLAEELGVSRTPVREAFYMLERDGLVELVPGKGAVVGGFEEQDVVEIYEVRELLEPHAVAVASCLAGERDVAEVERLHRAVAALDQSSAREAFQLNGLFHQRLCEPCQNRVLLSLLRTVWSHPLAVFMFPYQVQSEQAVQAMVAEHEAIVDAYRARDGETVRELVRVHIARAREELVELLQEQHAAARTRPTSP